MTDVAGFLVLIGRVLFALFLAIISGYEFHLKNAKMAQGHPQSVGFPAPGSPAWLRRLPDRRVDLFWRNVMIFASCLIMIGFFASVGDALPYSVTGALIDLN